MTRNSQDNWEFFVINFTLSNIILTGRFVMINLAVINLKTLLKKIMKMILVILVFAMMIKLAKVLYGFGKKIDLENIKLNNHIGIIKNNLALAKTFETDERNKDSELKKILVAQLAVFSGAEEEIMEKENQEEVLTFENVEESLAVESAVEEKPVEPQVQEQPQTTAPIQTAVIENNNKKDVYTDTYKTVHIKNESDYSLTEAMVTPDVKYKNTKDMIIYHTHTCESYTPTENSQYVETGNYRTTDMNYSVVKVGSELANNLAGKGYTVIHDKTYHDYPAYTGSYTRSLSTIKNLLNTYNTVEAVFDVHRDALRK